MLNGTAALGLWVGGHASRIGRRGVRVRARARTPTGCFLPSLPQEPILAHKGMLQCARAILNDIMKRQVLQAVMENDSEVQKKLGHDLYKRDCRCGTRQGWARCLWEDPSWLGCWGCAGLVRVQGFAGRTGWGKAARCGPGSDEDWVRA